MNRLRAAAWAAVLLTAPAAAQGFEGTLKLRTVVVDRAQLGKVTGAKAPDTDQALAITAAQLLDAKDAGAEMRESMVYVNAAKVRMDLPLEKNKQGYAIIDTEKDTTWFVIPGEKRYIEWSQADAKVMSEKMAQLEKMMKERMATLPPEQRAQVEAMLKKMQGPAEGEAAPGAALKATGKTETVNGYKAAGYQVQSGDEIMLGWVTQEQPEIAATLQTVQSRLEKMTPASLRGRQAARNALGEKGLPVRVHTLDPAHYRVEEVVAIEKKTLTADVFALPKDFAKTTARDAMKNIAE
jgi:hypothetical protein